MALNKFIQIALAIVIVLFVIVYGLPVFFNTKATSDKNDVVGGDTISAIVIEGKLPLSNSAITVHTSVPNQDEYMELPRSKNLIGGAQYSYSFWMNFNNVEQALNKVLLLRGSTDTGTVIVTKNAPSEDSAAAPRITKVKVSNNKYDEVVEKKENVIMLKQPLIQFGSNPHQFVVKINTNNHPEYVWEIDASGANTSEPNTFKMYTFTFEDFVAADGFSNGFIIRFYVNDTEIASHRVAGQSLRLNEGPLYILPAIGPANSTSLRGEIVDITYYNYALKKHDLTALVKMGFNDVPATTPGQRRSKLASKNQYYQLSLEQQLNQA